jgi:sulfopyruvate decarboxylase subunit beta
VYAFDDVGAWRAGAAGALAGPGPVVVVLKVEGRAGQKTPQAPRPMAEQIARLRGALGEE